MPNNRIAQKNLFGKLHNTMPFLWVLYRCCLLSVPSFLWALTVIADGDLVATLPRTLVRAHGERFGVTALEPPLPFGPTRVRVVATRAAMNDAGIAWLVALLAREAPKARRGERSAAARRPETSKGRRAARSR